VNWVWEFARGVGMVMTIRGNITVSSQENRCWLEASSLNKWANYYTTVFLSGE
jgi:hypothetical protein